MKLRLKDIELPTHYVESTTVGWHQKGFLDLGGCFKLLYHSDRLHLHSSIKSVEYSSKERQVSRLFYIVSLMLSSVLSFLLLTAYTTWMTRDTEMSLFD